MLRLDTEEEAAREREDVVDARHPLVLNLIWRQVLFLKITVSERDQPPDHGKAQPREKETQGKAEQRPSPLRIYQGREDILKEA